MSEPVKHVLMLGASGFIGAAVLKTLLKEGYYVTAIEHNTRIQTTHPKLTIVNITIGSLDFNKLPNPPHIIVHAARNRTGRFGNVGRFLKSLQGYYENKSLLKKISKLHTNPKIIYCSGSLMYGSYENKIIDESFPLRPASFAKQYYIAELPFLNAIRRGQRVIMLRLPWVIGNGSWFAWSYFSVMKNKCEVPVYGDGNNKMCFIDVGIIGEAIVRIEKKDFTGLLNLFHPQCLSQNEWAEMLSEISGLPVKKLSIQELASIDGATREAFSTNIKLGSLHTDIQSQLAPLHLPLKEIVRKHLPQLEHK